GSMFVGVGDLPQDGAVGGAPPPGVERPLEGGCGQLAAVEVLVTPAWELTVVVYVERVHAGGGAGEPSTKRSGFIFGWLPGAFKHHLLIISTKQHPAKRGFCGVFDSGPQHDPVLRSGDRDVHEPQLFAHLFLACELFGTFGSFSAAGANV